MLAEGDYTAVSTAVSGPETARADLPDAALTCADTRWAYKRQAVAHLCGKLLHAGI